MRNKKNVKRFLTVFTASAIFALAVSSCTIGVAPSITPTPSTPTVEEKIRAIYDQGVSEGKIENMSYEEWLDSIKGDPGQDGKDGVTPTVEIGSDGYWYINGVNTEIKAQGSEGTPGKDGTSVLNGHGAPASNLGVEGDSYIDLDTWNFYVKTANGWGEPVGNIKGDKGDKGDPDGPKGDPGEPGEDGTSLISGNGAPTIEQGKEGDSYINLTNWDFYIRTAGGWSLVGNIKGQQGDPGTPGDHGDPGTPGKDGTSLITGENPPLSNTGNVGDSYIDVSTWKFYVKDQTGWHEVGCIKGEQGDPGSPGSQGTPGTPGSQGEPGQDGTSLRTGSGAPASGLGIMGDSYIDLSTWNFYVKTVNGWTLMGNIKGEPGEGGGGGSTPVTVIHTVEFVLRVGEMPEGYSSTVQVEHGAYISDLPIPTLLYHEFEGWYAGEPFTVNTGKLTNLTPIMSDLTVYGYWSAATFTLVIDYDNGNAPEVYYNVDQGTYTPKDFEYFESQAIKDGYTFDHWEINGEPFTESYSFEGNTTVTAVYTPVSEDNVSFILYEDSTLQTVMHSVPVPRGFVLRSINYPTKDGFICTGFKNVEDDEDIEFPYTFNDNTAWYCVWVEDTGPTKNWLYLDPKNGEEVQEFSYTTGYVFDEAPYIPEYGGHQFQGYVYSDDKSPVVWPLTLSEDIYIEAVWKEVSPEDRYKTLDIYASNDFHGMVEEVTYVNENDHGKDYYEPGLAKYASFFKEKSALDNTLLLDQGDTWQGSIYAGLNFGNMVNDVMIEAGWDERTVGNHDFDWGVDKVKANTAREYDGKTLTTLGANIYGYNFEQRKFLDNHLDDIGGTTAVFETENGLRVGVIGVIGDSQITSIETSLVKNVGFADHIKEIKTQSAYLKTTEGCDVIIVSIHGGQEDVLGNQLEKCCDLVLCAHTHRSEWTIENGLHYGQFYKNGRQAGHYTLVYDTQSGKVDQNQTERERINSADMKSQVVDETIAALIAESKVETDLVGDVVVHNNVSGEFDTNEYAPNLMATAIYEEAQLQGYTDIDFTFVNQGRAILKPDGDGKLRYKDIYGTFPFANKVYIMNISGEEIYKELVSYNNIYNAHTSKTYSVSGTAKIACLDYLAGHVSDAREYNYFPYGIQHVDATMTSDYRTMLVDYLARHTEQIVNTNYSNNLPVHNRSAIEVKCQLELMMNDGTDTVYQTLQLNYRNVIYNYLPANPSRSGYTFGGWYRDAVCTQELSSRWYITGDMRIYAKWTIEEPEPPQPDDRLVLVKSLTLADFASQELNESTGDTKSGSFTVLAYSEDNTQSQEVAVAYEGMWKAEQYGQLLYSHPASIRITAPTGYRITSVQAETYNTYENLAFYNSEGNAMTWRFVPNADAYRSSWYIDECSETSIMLADYSTYNVYLYFLTVTLTPVS